jgi:hypothetical protein
MFLISLFKVVRSIVVRSYDADAAEEMRQRGGDQREGVIGAAPKPKPYMVIVLRKPEPYSANSCQNLKVDFCYFLKKIDDSSSSHPRAFTF